MELHILTQRSHKMQPNMKQHNSIPIHDEMCDIKWMAYKLPNM